MSEAEIDRAVAEATGESLSTASWPPRLLADRAAGAVGSRGGRRPAARRGLGSVGGRPLAARAA